MNVPAQNGQGWEQGDVCQGTITQYILHSSLQWSCKCSRINSHPFEYQGSRCASNYCCHNRCELGCTDHRAKSKPIYHTPVHRECFAQANSKPAARNDSDSNCHKYSAPDAAHQLSRTIYQWIMTIDRQCLFAKLPVTCCKEAQLGRVESPRASQLCRYRASLTRGLQRGRAY